MVCRRFHLALCVLAVLVLSAGCSTPGTRSKEKSAVFGALPKKFQEAVLKGEILEGMTPDAVFIALGEPDRIVRGQEKGVKEERWIYGRMETRETPVSHEVRQKTSEGMDISFRHYDSIQVGHLRDRFEVKFEQGKVVGWRGL